jgi:hypothetical protein
MHVHGASRLNCSGHIMTSNNSVKERKGMIAMVLMIKL